MIKAKGFSLIELLIGLFLSCFIMAILLEFYLNHKRHYIQMQAQLSAHLDAWFIGDLLTDSIRKAGFTPCISVNHLTVHDERVKQRPIAALTIFNGERINISRMSEHFASLTLLDNLHLFTKNKLPLRAGNAVMVADCERGEIHTVERIEKRAHGYMITLLSPLIFSYSNRAYVGRWLEESWYIRSNRQQKTALYYKLSQSEELSADIDALSVVKKLVNNKTVLQLTLHTTDKTLHLFTSVVRGV